MSGPPDGGSPTDGGLPTDGGSPADDGLFAAKGETHPRVLAATGPGSWWSRVDHLAEVTSTHDVALGRLRDGEEPGFVVVADRQTAGRGRSGRGWEDGPTLESSLMLTATVRAPAGELTLVPLAVGLAVADATAAVGVDVALKWPNDVLVEDRKCVGILVERHTVPSAAAGHGGGGGGTGGGTRGGVSGGAADVLLVGVGMDVDWRGADRAGERGAWTSLAEELGGDIDRFELLGALLDTLAARIGTVTSDGAALVDAYRERCSTLGRDVEAALPGGDILSGWAVDVDPRGRLLIDTARERVAVAAGDVTHVRPAR